MKAKQPTLADLMKKLDALEAEVRALRAAPAQHHHHYYPTYPPSYGTYYPGAYYSPPYTITVGQTAGLNVTGTYSACQDDRITLT